MARKRRTSPTIEGHPYSEVQTYIESYTASRISEATSNIISSGMLIGEPGADGESFVIPGPAGVAGATGATGAPGLGVPGADGADGESWMIPGPAGAAGTPGGGGFTMDVQEEGALIQTDPSAIDFVGAGVTATALFGVVTVTIPGGGGGDMLGSNNLSDVLDGNASLNTILPPQTGNNGKVLQTDGTNTSWQTVSGGSGLTQPQVMARALGC